MAEIRWTLKASNNVNAIFNYISADSKFYAGRFAKSLINSTKKLQSLPECGRIVPEFQNKELRELIYQNYRIVYRFIKDSNIVEILAVVHSARDFSSALESD